MCVVCYLSLCVCMLLFVRCAVFVVCDLLVVWYGLCCVV